MPFFHHLDATIHAIPAQLPCKPKTLSLVPFPLPSQRPLSGAQLQYAAADAACLLALLGSLVAVVGQPEEWPMTEAAVEASGPQPAAGAAAVAARSEDQQAAANGADESAAEGADGEAEGAPEVQAADGSGGSSRSRSSSGNASEQTGTAGPATPQQQQQQASSEAASEQQALAAPAANLLGGCTVQQLRAAASAWGVRLEISGARAVKRGGRRGQRQRREARRGSGRLEPEAPCGFPLHVPFWDAERQVGLIGDMWFVQKLPALPGHARPLASCLALHAISTALISHHCPLPSPTCHAADWPATLPV